MARKTPREAAERIIAGYREVCTMTPHVPCVPENSSDNAVILAVEYLREHAKDQLEWMQPSQYRCNLCGGLVRFDGTKPGAE